MSLDAAPHRRAVLRAMQHPDRLLAAALGEIPDAELAALIGAELDLVWQLRLCGWPRNECWARDVERMAAVVCADPKRLARLLVEVGVRKE